MFGSKQMSVRCPKSVPTFPVRWGLLLAVVLSTTACRLGHLPSAAIEMKVPPVPTKLYFVPEVFAQIEDRAGRLPRAQTHTATPAQALSALEFPDTSDGLIPSILAVTGTVTFDLPMSDDERVLYWVEFLKGRGRRSFSRWLGRSTRYVPLFWSILEQYDMPKDLVFLSMIESGFSPTAYSWAHAAGAWQFMPYTGRRFGLHVGFWVDERRDFVKSTHAAAQYLSRLYKMFDNWWLAMAAYNAGPGRMRSAIRKSGTDDFWQISRTRQLRRETKHYVPKLLAAARIAKQPDRYGFGDVKYLPALSWQDLNVDVSTDLKMLTRVCALDDAKVLQDLNPELRCRVTPPGQSYTVRVPQGALEACKAGLLALNPAVRMTYRYAVIAADDTLERLAQRHHTSVAAIVDFNQIAPEQLQDLAEIVVPVPLLSGAEVEILAPDPKLFRGSSYRPDGQQLIVHRVRSGDSLWRIARRYRVGLRKLRLWNGLWKRKSLRVGQRIKVYIGRGRAPGSRGYKRPKAS